VLYTVHFTAFCLGGPFLSGHGVVTLIIMTPLWIKIIAIFLLCCVVSGHNLAAGTASD